LFQVSDVAFARFLEFIKSAGMPKTIITATLTTRAQSSAAIPYTLDKIAAEARRSMQRGAIIVPIYAR